MIRDADPYVYLSDGLYVLDVEGAKAALSADQVSSALELIDASNSTIARASNGENRALAFGSDKSIVVNRATFIDGVTKVEAHWYGFRVWLSKDTVRGIGGGVGIGALWIPEPLVSKILASLGGAVAAFAPGGVVFNYTPVIGPATPLGVFWGQEWQ